MSAIIFYHLQKILIMIFQIEGMVQNVSLVLLPVLCQYCKVRDDYKELNNLCIKFLVGKISSDFRAPGASHKARWMAKLLYNFIICLLQSANLELPPSTIKYNNGAACKIEVVYKYFSSDSSLMVFFFIIIGIFVLLRESDEALYELA